jgi:hypothetical protein
VRMPNLFNAQTGLKSNQEQGYYGRVAHPKFFRIYIFPQKWVPHPFHSSIVERVGTMNLDCGTVGGAQVTGGRWLGHEITTDLLCPIHSQFYRG